MAIHIGNTFILYCVQNWNDMALISKALEVYQRINYEWADPRTNDFLLVSSPSKVLAILGLYLWFCLKAGPHFMKDREPFNLKNSLIIYNTFQVLMSAYFFAVCFPRWVFIYSYTCEPVDYSYNSEALYMAAMSHIYFLSKIVELLDTVFFILRKKYSQASTLHLYHHTVMVLMTWIYVKYAAGGQSTFTGFINSFVHIIVYSYYLIASLGPKYQKYLKWKRQLTMIQLVQFIILLIHSLQALPRECSYNKAFVWVPTLQALVFIYMFSNFYIQTYVKPKKINNINGNLNNDNSDTHVKKM